MERVVTSTEMQACDRLAIRNLRIPGSILMENAGRGVVEKMIDRYGSLNGKSVLIFCGKGNNGGDGFVVARHLIEAGSAVSAVLVGNASGLKGEAKQNCLIWKTLVKRLGARGNVSFVELKSAQPLRRFTQPDFIVDALFGTGVHGEVRGIYKDVIDWMNRSHARSISVDLPSGVDADNGRVGNVAVEADLTVTIGMQKIGLIIGDGRTYAGRVEAVNMGIPAAIFPPVSRTAFLVDRGQVRRNIPARPLSAHKHSVGKIVVIAGSNGLTGAAAMTSQSAMRSGAGSVILCTPASVYPILARKLTEVMVEPYSETPQGTLALGSYQDLLKRISWADIVVLGPGLSRNKETEELIQKLVARIELPLLIDADGLNAFSGKRNLLAQHRSREVIITPHSGELSRLTGVSSAEIDSGRVEYARTSAKKFRVTVVLKGAPTVTSSESGIAYINSTGNPAMATAGMGDVLSGCIAGLWGQGMNRTEAAYSGVFIHGLAGDFCNGKLGDRGLLSTDVQNILPEIIREVMRGIPQ
ncbi:MAG TPA: NAD(P)H-hydrate dehydratase [Bacteroidota bacterium]|nr:NAD(P)H-hydrate dehydratase [Bacteroidota bacterium]